MSPRILVADDSTAMRRMMLRSLQAIGVPGAIEAADGDEAISTFRAGEFDLVLADWSMPGKNGLEVTRAIRQQDPLVPIILVATAAERDRLDGHLPEGVSDCIVKPFTSDALREKLEQHGC